MSITLNNWNDLSKYGIGFLTGESCAYSQRLLCDLNEDGAKLMSSFFSIKQDAFSENWNSSVNGKPAIASILLPRGIFGDLCLFLLFSVNKCHYAVRTDHGWYGYTDADLEEYDISIEKVCTLYKGELYRNPLAIHQPNVVDGRNVHAFTSRST